MKHFFMSTWVTVEASGKTSVLERDTVPKLSHRRGRVSRVTGRGKGDPGSRQCKWNFSLFCPRDFLVTRSRCIRKPLCLKGPTLFFCPLSWQLFYRVSAIGKVHSHGTWLMLKLPALCSSFLALPWPLTLESSDIVPLIINGWKHGPPDLCFSDCNAHTNTWTSVKMEILTHEVQAGTRRQHISPAPGRGRCRWPKHHWTAWP